MSTEQTQPGVLIVGAGTTGLISAIALRLAGVSVRIVDRLQAPRTSSRALGLQARAMEALEMLGVVSEIERRARRLQGSLILNERGLLGQQRWVPPQAPYPFTYVLGQQDLEAVLRDRLHGVGVDVEWGTEVAAISDKPAAALATTTTGESIAAAWIIGADGPGSIVRAAAGLEFAGRTTDQTWALADVDLAADPADTDAMTWMTADGALMLMRLVDRPRFWRFFADVTDQHRIESFDETSTELVRSVLDRRATGTRIEIVRSVWSSLYRVQIRQAVAYRKGRLVIAGDAAHVFPPFGGQGMNTGILDAMNLAWKLAVVLRGGATERLVDTYNDERVAIGRQVVREVEQRAALFAARGRLARFGRDALFRLVLASAAAQRRNASAVSQLDQSITGTSRLTHTLRGAPRPRAGERAPDTMIRDRRLFLQREPMTFTVLGHRPPALADVGLPVQRIIVSDDDAKAVAAYNLRKGEHIVIRPDGVVGCRGDDRTVRRWFAEVAT